MDKVTLNGLLRPKSIAVVGASATPGKIGYTVLDNLIKQGYIGKIYPINPKDPEILGLKCYASVLNIEEDVDAAVITVPAKFCAQVIEECGQKGVTGLIVISSGFSEVGRHDLEDQIVDIAHKYHPGKIK